MVAFEWVVNAAEKIEIIQNIFQTLSLDETRSLVNSLDQFSENAMKSRPLPIAFYRHLKSSVTDNHLWRQVNALGVKEWVKRCKMGGLSKNSVSYDLNTLILHGKEILEAGQLINHLWHE